MADSSLCKNALSTISNIASISYEFSTDPNQPNNFVSGNTNAVVTDTVCVYTEKFANKYAVVVGDVVTYTVNVINNSTISINNLIFYDTIPTGTSLVPNSFNVANYGNIIGANPNVGIDLSTIVGELAPQSSCVLSFDVMFDYLPCPKQLINTANVAYQYQG